MLFRSYDAFPVLYCLLLLYCVLEQEHVILQYQIAFAISILIGVRYIRYIISAVTSIHFDLKKSYET